MATSYQGRDIQKQSDVGLRLEKLPFVDYTNYDETTGLGAVQSEINWLVADNNLYSSSVEFDKESGEAYSASYFLPTIINVSGAFYGSLSGIATSASYALSASYAPLSIDTSSFYISSPGNILFVNRYLLIAKGDGNVDTIDLSTLEAASASYATYALTASYAMNGGGGSGSSPAFPFTGAAVISGSLVVTGSLSTIGSALLIGSNTNIVSTSSYASNDFFLVRNATTSLSVNSGVQITSSANTPLQVLDTNNNNLLQVSQSGVVIYSTSSVAPTGTAPNGALLFTSTGFFIGLD